MTLDEYFNQDKYFSESTQELVSIDEMAFPHAFNAWRRLATDDLGGEFIGSRLDRAFMQRLSPSPERIREQLRQYGVSSHIFYNGSGWARNKFYRAAKQLGVKVTTHRQGMYVRAEVVDAGTQVRVKGEKVV